jgi:predicted permease
MTPTPPRLAVRVLAWALRSDPAVPAILGDLHEDFTRAFVSRGPRAARFCYWREALHLVAARGFRARPSRAALLPPLAQDGVYALRVLSRAPAFSLLTACTVALGVGAATTVFSVLQPLMISPLPFADAGALVWIQNQGEPGDGSLSAITSRTANLYDFRERSRSFEGLTGYHAFFDQRAFALTGVGEPERLVGVGVAHDFLDVLGVEPQLGRSFSVEEGLLNGPAAVLLSHGFWVRRFAGDPSVVGRSLTLNEEPYTVVGVLPEAFDFSSIFTPGSDVDFLLPFPVLSGDRGGFQGNVLFMIGRLRPGVSVEAAQAELEGVMGALRAEDPRRWGLGAAVSPLSEHVAGPYRPALLLLAAAAGTLMLLVCVNVSNLFLARSPSRARELAVRKALGASRWRLVRQLVLETLAVSVVGAALGSVLAAGATGLVSRATIRIPLLDAVRVDGTALLFATAAAVLAGLLVAVLPAIQVADGGEATVLRSSVRGMSASRSARRLQETLVFAQVTLACGLLVVGGLLVRSFRSVTAVDLGRRHRLPIRPRRRRGCRAETTISARTATSRLPCRRSHRARRPGSPRRRTGPGRPPASRPPSPRPRKGR